MMTEKGAIDDIDFGTTTGRIEWPPVSLDVAGAECVVIRKDVFLLLDAEYDANPMTPLEMDLLADEADEIVSRGEPRRHWNAATCSRQPIESKGQVTPAQPLVHHEPVPPPNTARVVRSTLP